MLILTPKDFQFDLKCCTDRKSHKRKSVPFQGTIGFEAQIDKCLELSEYLYNKIKDREGYEMVFDGKVCLFFTLHRDHSFAGTQPVTSSDY